MHKSVCKYLHVFANSMCVVYCSLAYNSNIFDNLNLPISEKSA